MSTGYVPKEYWDNRLKEHWDLTGVGFGGHSARYNKWLYRFQELTLAAALRKAGVKVEGARVLDVGSGIGYWVRWYYRNRPAHVTSVDITPTAVQNLRTLFPQATVHEADVSMPGVQIPPHDIVNIISVLYHIVDPELFQRALANLVAFTAPGGHLVRSDRMGDREVRPAEHVRFRALETYETALHALGMEIRHVQPMHVLMNGGLRALFAGAPSRIRGLARRAEESLAPAWYVVDQLPGMSTWANSHILVARKKA
jgi:2-polyprenyl-3-methyl-5-hydroxy-6-metoxy-1,4-benzoquinol methylase